MAYFFLVVEAVEDEAGATPRSPLIDDPTKVIIPDDAAAVPVGCVRMSATIMPPTTKAARLKNFDIKT